MIQVVDPDPAKPKGRMGESARVGPAEEQRIARLDRLIRDLALLVLLVVATSYAAVQTGSPVAFVGAIVLNVGGLLYLRGRYRADD